MKLLTCARCNEVFSLGYDYKECSGKHGGGKYVTNISARIWGPKDLILTLGFANTSFVNAAREQIQKGDLKTGQGREFTAFIIPNETGSVRRFETREAAEI
jgi:hypothetical protein